jgi:starch phosphorylase
MEIGLDPSLPTYSGGLGVLAGDTVRAGADLAVPMVAVTLLYRQGYFYQRIDPEGRQQEEPVHWVPEDHVELLPTTVALTLEGRRVQVGAWRYRVAGCGRPVEVILLDTNLPENDEADRPITDRLYLGDPAHRLRQEAVLGIGGLRMLRALGHRSIHRYHMNEGHASLLVIELLAEEARARESDATDPAVVEAVRERCVFTTHTPVAAGHDRFPADLVLRTLGPTQTAVLSTPEAWPLFFGEEELNLTYLGFNLSGFINGVAKRHEEVSRLLFGDYPIAAITNGVHAETWVSRPFAELFDRHITGWRQDNFTLRYAHGLENGEIWRAHRTAKQSMVEWINRRTNAGLDIEHFTIAFARRAATYKRPGLVLRDADRLRAIAEAWGPIQIVFAGKAHPADGAGKAAIERIVGAIPALKPHVRMVYLPNYDMHVCRRLVAGADLWLNTPRPPLEASGTSGMKAALNGIPSLSVLDGWWLEGWIEGVTGWAIGGDRWRGGGRVDPEAPADAEHDAADAASLYDKLDRVILPLFRDDHDGYVDVMRQAIAINGSFFNTQRMMQQYVIKAYREGDGAPASVAGS